MLSLDSAKSLALIGSLAAMALAENPIISHRYLADPNGFVYNQRLYAICSKDDDNVNGYDMRGSILISTKDLMNWTDHGEVYHAPKDGTWGSTAYAPTAVVRDGKVYYYVPNSGSAIGVVVADRPEGPVRNPKNLISGTLCDGVAWCFDPGAFVDDDGQAYLVYGGGSNTGSNSGYGQNIRIVKLNKDMVSLGGSPIRLSLDKSFEGPFLSKYKGNYYLQYPMEGSSNIGLSMSTQPTSGWTHKGSILDNPSLNGRNINGNNNSHTSIMEYEGQWYMFYHDRRLSNGAAYKRNVSIEKLTYNTDGTIKKVVVTTGIPQTRNFNPYDSIPAVTYSKQSLISAHTDVNNTGVRRVNLLVPRKSGAWMRISSVDFSTGAKSFQIHGGGTAAAAKVESPHRVRNRQPSPEPAAWSRTDQLLDHPLTTATPATWHWPHRRQGPLPEVHRHRLQRRLHLVQVHPHQHLGPAPFYLGPTRHLLGPLHHPRPRRHSPAHVPDLPGNHPSDRLARPRHGPPHRPLYPEKPVPQRPHLDPCDAHPTALTPARRRSASVASPPVATAFGALVQVLTDQAPKLRDANAGWVLRRKKMSNCQRTASLLRWMGSQKSAGLKPLASMYAHIS
jgi:hypothetical protein